MFNKPTNGSKYYYLQDSNLARKQKCIRKAELKRDLVRGVRRLSEEAYTDYWGTTSTSLVFFLTLQSFIGLQDVVEAELRHGKRHHYSLFLRTASGFEVKLKGVSGGYFGEGSRGCYDILKACGFSEKQCQKVWTCETFKVKRKVNKGGNLI